MPLSTTTIGAFPKPDYVRIPDWFGPRGDPACPTSTEADLDRAVRQVVRAQVGAGVAIPTDGEVRRENYVHYHCRHLEGIDFDRLTPKSMRDGAWEAPVPTVTGPIAPARPFLARDYQVAQQVTTQAVKITVPGPLTIMDTTADAYYRDRRRWGEALADALNVEVRRLAAAGCRHIQVDEPVFARYPDLALSLGIDLIERVFAGVPEQATRVLHVCCGYPDRLDGESYPKADPAAYFQLAPAIDRSSIEAISLEDAHRPNHLELFDRFERITVILGVVGIARSRVESVEEITHRAEQVLYRVGSDRLMLAPDCGLGMLDEQTALAKLRNISEAAKQLG